MEKRYIETSAQGFVLDSTSNAIINTNEHEYQRILAQRQKAKQLIQLQTEVESLKDDMKEIKDLLIKALSGR
jgi:cell shape-determining protein MreC